MIDDFPECTEDDLKPIMICMRLDELNRMHESKDPELFHALFGSLQDDEVLIWIWCSANRKPSGVSDAQKSLVFGF